MKKTPLRMCMVCREKYPKNEMIRIVRLPEGDIVVDETGKTQGRGGYVCKKAECINVFTKKHTANHSFKTNVQEEVYDRVKQLLTKA